MFKIIRFKLYISQNSCLVSTLSIWGGIFLYRFLFQIRNQLLNLKETHCMTAELNIVLRFNYNNLRNLNLFKYIIEKNSFFHYN